MIVHTRADQLLPQLLMELFDTLYTQCCHIEHMHEGIRLTKTYYGIDKMTFMRTWTIFFRIVLNRGYSSTCAMIMHTRADQLLSQLLMDSLDTLLSHDRHIGNLHEEV